MEPKFTHEDVTKMEDLLRYAQRNIETVGTMVCSSHNPVAINLWGECTKMAQKLSDMIYPLYKLRPEDSY